VQSADSREIRHGRNEKDARVFTKARDADLGIREGVDNQASAQPNSLSFEDFPNSRNHRILLFCDLSLTAERIRMLAMFGAKTTACDQMRIVSDARQTAHVFADARIEVALGTATAANAGLAGAAWPRMRTL